MNKLELAQTHITNFSPRMDYLKKEIKKEQKDIDKYMQQDNYYWIAVSAKKLSELCLELQNLSKTQKEMQDLLDFIKSDDTKQEGE